MEIKRRLDALGLVLPPAPKVPPGLWIPCEWLRIHGDRAFVSGHGALSSEGAPAGPFGKVPSEVSLEDARESAVRGTLGSLALVQLASLQRALGDLDQVSAWLIMNGFVNAEPGYAQTTIVLNSCSDLILELYGGEKGRHARTAIGVSALPL